MIELVLRSVGDVIEAGLLEDGRLTDYLPGGDGGFGEIHLGRIRSVDPALGAARVELVRGDGWLALRPARRLLPGTPLHEGAAVVVQISRAARDDKGPRVSADLVIERHGRRWRPLREPAPDDATAGLFERIRERAASTRAPALLHAPDRLASLVAEATGRGAVRLLADDRLAELKARRVLQADGLVDLDHEPGVWRMVAEQLQEALAREVPLAGGGSLVIEPTRALTVIDVNGHGRPALEIDLEAVPEIARQIRLRRLGGIIVVDFIDLERKEHRGRLHAELRRACRHDPLPVEVLPMTRLGLVQLTRKRLGPSLAEILTRPCPACAGEGRIAVRESPP